MRVQKAQHAGRDHIIDHKNMQDALRVFHTDDFLAGIICDGSSNGNLPETHSEVGAQAAAEFMIGAIREWSSYGHLTPKVIATKLDKELQRYLQALVAPFWWLDEAGLADYVKRHLQFTILGFIWTPKEFVVFYVGDGTLWINDEVHHLNEGNLPAYPAYRLVPYAIPNYYEPKMSIIPISRDGGVKRFAIGSDAFKDEKTRTGEIWNIERGTLQMRINIMSNIDHSFGDDVSIITVEDLPCEGISAENPSL